MRRLIRRIHPVLQRRFQEFIVVKAVEVRWPLTSINRYRRKTAINTTVKMVLSVGG